MILIKILSVITVYKMSQYTIQNSATAYGRQRGSYQNYKQQRYEGRISKNNNKGEQRFNPNLMNTNLKQQQGITINIKSNHLQFREPPISQIKASKNYYEKETQMNHIQEYDYRNNRYSKRQKNLDSDTNNFSKYQNQAKSQKDFNRQTKYQKYYGERQNIHKNKDDDRNSKYTKYMDKRDNSSVKYQNQQQAPQRNHLSYHQLAQEKPFTHTNYRQKNHYASKNQRDNQNRLRNQQKTYNNASLPPKYLDVDQRIQHRYRDSKYTYEQPTANLQQSMDVQSSIGTFSQQNTPSRLRKGDEQINSYTPETRPKSQNRKQQLINKSKVLRQKMNELSAKKSSQLDKQSHRQYPQYSKYINQQTSTKGTVQINTNAPKNQSNNQVGYERLKRLRGHPQQRLIDSPFKQNISRRDSSYNKYERDPLYTHQSQGTDRVKIPINVRGLPLDSQSGSRMRKIDLFNKKQVTTYGQQQPHSQQYKHKNRDNCYNNAYKGGQADVNVDNDGEWQLETSKISQSSKAREQCRQDCRPQNMERQPVYNSRQSASYRQYQPQADDSSYKNKAQLCTDTGILMRNSNNNKNCSNKKPQNYPEVCNTNSNVHLSKKETDCMTRITMLNSKINQRINAIINSYGNN